METPKPRSLIALLDAPLPPTGHPIGKLAKAWILLNCVAFGIVGGAIGAIEILRFCYRWHPQRQPSDGLADTVGIVAALLGLMVGLLGAS